MKRITIAIDGYSSCGKSTMAKALARRLSYIYVDTGAMYRAVTLFALDNGFIINGVLDKPALIASLGCIDVSFGSDGLVTLGGVCVEGRIRTMEVSENVSVVSAVPEVRHLMVELQRRIGRGGGVVMDGRDIGTVVFPDAELKIFVTADAEVRARRRFDELKAKGDEVVFDDVLANVKRRDYLDETREESPLRRADDAIVLDNGLMTIEQQDAWLMAKVEEVCRG